MPEVVGLGFGEGGEDVTGIVVAVGAGEDDDAETDRASVTSGPLPRFALDRDDLEAVVLDDGIGQKPAAHVVDVGLRLAESSPCTSRVM